MASPEEVWSRFGSFKESLTFEVDGSRLSAVVPVGVSRGSGAELPELAIE